jgi:hypothetical protein
MMPLSIHRNLTNLTNSRQAFETKSVFVVMSAENTRPILEKPDPEPDHSCWPGFAPFGVPHP